MAALVPLVAAAALVGMATSRSSEVEYVKSTVDGNSYLVLKRQDSAAAANMLAVIRRDLESLIQQFHTENPGDEAAKRLATKFDGSSTSEGAPSTGYTSYTIEKARIVLCMRQSNGDFVPKNVVMYVAIHELAHIMTSSVGHTPEFWKNNRRLLSTATQMGIYTKQDFSKAPQPYCGMHITA